MNQLIELSSHRATGWTHPAKQNHDDGLALCWTLLETALHGRHQYDMLGNYAICQATIMEDYPCSVAEESWKLDSLVVEVPGHPDIDIAPSLADPDDLLSELRREQSNLKVVFPPDAYGPIWEERSDNEQVDTNANQKWVLLPQILFLPTPSNHP